MDVWIQPAAVDSALTAIIAGALVSPHCLAMCGPLSCAVVGGGHGGADNRQNTGLLLYHAGRMVAYCLVGALAGLFGLAVVRAFGLAVPTYFPWLLVAALAVFGLGLDRRLRRPAALGRLFARAGGRIRRWPGTLTGLGLGLVTPLLPCAPLYAVFFVALLSGSPLFGAQLGLGFALGTFPLLWLGQSQLFRWQGRLSGRAIGYIQRGAALVGALILTWRLVMAEGPLNVPFCGLH